MMADPNEKGGRVDDVATTLQTNIGLGRTDSGDYVSGTSPKQPAVEQLEDYEASGAEFIRLDGKVPRKGWRTKAAMTPIEAMEHMEVGGNVGIRLRPTDLVIDVDPRNFAEGDNPIGRLANDLSIDLGGYPRVETGSGGSHYYMRLPEPMSVRNELPDYPGVEFKSHGRQVVSAGSVHPETGELYLWDEDPLAVPLGDAAPLATEALVELIRRPEVQSEGAEGGEVEPEQLEAMLKALAPEDYREHDAWLTIMMACHHATAGSGREQFIAWSVSDLEYAGHETMIEERWNSLRSNTTRRQVTQATLFKALADAGRCELIPRPTAEDDFAEEVNDNFESEDISPKRREGLADEWVYVIDAEVFVRRSDGKKWSKEQWRAAFAGRWKGDIVGAAFRGDLPVRKFESLVYLPCRAEFPDGEAGGRYNIWRESGVEAAPGDVSVFLEHMAYLVPNETERGHVIDYLSLLAQDPARKIDFALLVRGDQGTGKSWIGRLMAKVIGMENVVTPSNDEVMSNWTAWTEGSCLAIIEKMMAKGRLDMANRLKPIITDPQLRIENKNCRIYSIPNHLNLMAFTNHEDALPLEAGDRRWLVVFSEAQRREDAYYDRLFAFLRGDGPAAVKHFLLERKPGLNPKSVAPATAGKAMMRKRSLSDAEQYLDEMLEGHEGPFAFDLVRLDDLLAYVPNDLKRNVRGLRNKVASWLKDEAKAVRHTRYTKGDSDTRPSCQLWSVRNHAEWEEAGAAARAEAFARRHETAQ